jgi:hypothetical protein
MFLYKIKKRKFSLVGIFFILLALDVLIRSELIIYDVTPMLGEILPYVKMQPANELSPVVMKVISWPFYVPLLVGCTFVGLDVNQIMKSRETEKEMEQTVQKATENEVV